MTVFILKEVFPICHNLTGHEENRIVVIECEAGYVRTNRTIVVYKKIYI